MDVQVLIGQTLATAENKGNEELLLTTIDGKKYRFSHYQDCCESVTIEDINGSLDDLVGSPILLAEEATSDKNPPDMKPLSHYQDESFTWTFYKFATAKGHVTVRWHGTSNGYYSESVDFEEMKTGLRR